MYQVVTCTMLISRSQELIHDLFLYRDIESRTGNPMPSKLLNGAKKKMETEKETVKSSSNGKKKGSRVLGFVGRIADGIKSKPKGKGIKEGRGLSGSQAPVARTDIKDVRITSTTFKNSGSALEKTSSQSNEYTPIQAIPSSSIASLLMLRAVS